MGVGKAPVDRGNGWTVAEDVVGIIKAGGVKRGKALGYAVTGKCCVVVVGAA